MSVTPNPGAPDDIPIDILYNKLIDWLVDRKWIKADFREKSDRIRTLINAAIQDMPDVEEITNLLRGSYITYYHCQRIVELLKVSEADSRSFFGTYSSQRMNDWLEILRQYNQDSIFLGECARMLQHNVNYEIPSLKRKLASSATRITDADRREMYLKGSIITLQEKFTSLCKDIGITGDDIHAELLELRQSLPAALAKVAALVRSDAFHAAMCHHDAFVRFTVGDDTDDTGAEETSSDAKNTPLLPLLTYLHRNGNTSCYEWATGKPLPPVSAAPSTQPPNAASGIDFGGTGDSGGVDFGDAGDSGGIDFGDAGDSGGIDFGDAGDSGGIDFGDAGDSGGIDFGDAGDSGGIDFGDAGDSGGIDFGDSGTTSKPVESGEASKYLASRITLLEDTDTRNKIVDEILQLEGFVLQRADELSQALDVTAINQFAGAPAGVVCSVDAVAEMVAAVTGSREALTTPAMQRLILIASSKKYVARLASSLEHQKNMSTSVHAKIDAVRSQRTAAQETIAELEPKCADIVRQTKHLQKEVEQSISTLYKGRKVNITGAINVM